MIVLIFINIFITRTPSVASPTGWFVTDTVGWTKIKGIYTAHGGEQWLTLGHFIEDSSQKQNDTVILSLSGIIDTICHMYVDDVCVRDMTVNSGDSTVVTNSFPVTIQGKTFAGTYNYKWSTGATTEAITVYTPGTYWRSITGECMAYTDTIRVFQSQSCLLIPSAFTPNNDGRNDLFHIQSECELTYYHLKIYNRYGQMVFTSDNIYSIWDGTFNGSPVEIGTYFYYIEYQPNIPNPTYQRLKGGVTVVR